MKGRDRLKSNLSDRAHELLTYALHLQGDREKTIASLQHLDGDEHSPEQCLFAGQLHADYANWDRAIEYLMKIPAERIPNDQIGKSISDALLKAAIHFSGAEDWDQALRCLAAAQIFSAENPSLQYLPKEAEQILIQVTGSITREEVTSLT